MFGNRQRYAHEVRYDDKSHKGIRKKQNYQSYREKLANTTILNADYKTVIEKYNQPDTLFYLDPPYSEQKASWGYNEGSNITPEELLNELRKIKGYFLMSYDYSTEIKKLFEKYFKVKIVQTKYETDKNSIPAKELIIMNY